MYVYTGTILNILAQKTNKFSNYFEYYLITVLRALIASAIPYHIYVLAFIHICIWYVHMYINTSLNSWEFLDATKSGR